MVLGMVFFVLVDRGQRDVGAVGDGLVDADDLLGVVSAVPT